MGEPTRSTDPDEPRPLRDDLVAALIGLVAIGVAAVPLAFFLIGGDDGPRGGRPFAEAGQWGGLRRFAMASVVGIVPGFGLAGVALRRARRWPATVPGAIAMVAALPMIGGAAIQVAWWLRR